MKSRSIHLADKPWGIIITENQCLLIEVKDDLEKGCFANYPLSREADLKYLRVLKKEYLAPNTSDETIFKN